MIALPLIDLLETLLYWALRYAVLALIVAALQAIRIGVPGLGWLVGSITGGLVKVVHYIEHEIAKAVLGVEAGVTNFIYGVAGRIEHAAFSGYYTASRMLEALEILVGSEIPRYVAGALSGTSHLAGSAAKAIRSLEHELGRDVARLGAATRAMEHDIARAIVAAEKAVRHAVAVTLPQALPWVDKRESAVEAKIAALFRRFRGVPFELTVGTIGAIALGFLIRSGLGWLRCSNISKLGRAACRLPQHRLEELLSLIADFVILRNICQVIPWLEDGFAVVAAPLIETLAVVGGKLCSPPSERAPVLVVPPTGLPTAADITFARS